MLGYPRILREERRYRDQEGLIMGIVSSLNTSLERGAQATRFRSTS